MAKAPESTIMSDAVRLAKLGQAFISAAEVAEILETKDSQIAERNRKLDELMKRTGAETAKLKDLETAAAKARIDADKKLADFAAAHEKDVAAATEQAKSIIAQAVAERDRVFAAMSEKVKVAEAELAKCATNVAALAKQEAEILDRIAKAREAAKALLGA